MVPYEQTVRPRMRRVCRGTPVHYEQAVREENASVQGYTGTL